MGKAKLRRRKKRGRQDFRTTIICFRKHMLRVYDIRLND